MFSYIYIKNGLECWPTYEETGMKNGLKEK